MLSDLFIDRHPEDERWGHATGPGSEDGTNLHYVRQNAGGPAGDPGGKPKGKPVVVLLHGWPGFWYDWRRVLPHLVEEFDAVALDFRGFGGSDRPELPPEEFATEGRYAADVLALLDHLEVERCALVGHDIGAVVAQAVARQRPERVSALVLGNPSYPGVGGRRYEASAQREMWYQHLHVLPWSHRLIGHDRATVELYLGHFYDHWVGRKESVRPEEFRAIVETFARPGAVEASLGWYRARAAERARREFTYDGDIPAKITCPTVVLWGELDPVFPPEWSDRLDEFFPNLVSLRRLPGVGHFVPFEAPEEMLKAIRDAQNETST